MQGLGYRRLVSHLLGEIGLDEATEETKKDTRRFSKRQLTWFGKEPGLRWVPPDSDEIEKKAAAFWATSE
jgi:tRNA dimethylallyltransferase